MAGSTCPLKTFPSVSTGLTTTTTSSYRTRWPSWKEWRCLASFQILHMGRCTSWTTKTAPGFKLILCMPQRLCCQDSYLYYCNFLGWICCSPQVFLGLRNPWKWQQEIFRFLACLTPREIHFKLPLSDDKDFSQSNIGGYLGLYLGVSLLQVLLIFLLIPLFFTDPNPGH